MTLTVEPMPMVSLLLSLIRKQQLAEHHLDQHQEALVGFEHAAALHHYLCFCRELNEVMLVQENELLPLYESLEQWEPGGEPQLIRAEHQKARRMMHDLMKKMEVACTPENLTRYKVIGLIEAEKTLKGLMEHHHLREEKHLYPAIKQVAGKEVR